MNNIKYCSTCKYCDEDFIFDEKTGEEHPCYECQKGNDTSLDYQCKDFEQYKSQKYVEKYTKCDKCKHFKECEEYLLETTNYLDEQKHYINGIGHVCKIDIPKKPLKKKQFIELYKQMPDRTNVSIGELFERAIIDGIVEDKKC